MPRRNKVQREGSAVKAWVPWALMGPGFLWLLVFFAYPLVRLLMTSLDDSERTRNLGGGGVKNYSHLYT